MRIIKIDKDICITGDKPIILQDSICEIYSMIFYKTKEYESENDSREKEKKRKELDALCNSLNSLSAAAEVINKSMK
nr:MAG TPA: hypothetical protein [Bacteriophage sp.]